LIAACPTCGVEVEFRYDDSFVRVCGHCRAAVLRTDRGLESLGKVADLVPMDSPLHLFAEGHHGSATFLLVGMAQIRHAAGGMWQEWYAKLDGGAWGWLAEAQGRYYLTFEQVGAQVPALEACQVGATVELPVNGRARTFTVAERGTAQYVAANGELPYRLVPDGAFRFVDLDDGQGSFATIDYGESGDQPALYVGHQVSLAEMRLTGGEVGPSRDKPISAARLVCPSCGAPVDLRTPGDTQRVVCAYCNTLLDLQAGNLAILAKLKDKAQPAIPLGSQGTFREGQMTVIGFVQRSAYLDDTWWPFDEYLLHAPGLGFRWLVQSDGHWSYVEPVSPGAVKDEFSVAVYDGVKFRKFQQAQLRVDQVFGELYWRVAAGETAQGVDYIAPPAMLSCEQTADEINWSLSTYMTPNEVRKAFGDDNLLLGSPPTGVAPNQVDPVKAASNALTLAFALLVLVGLGFAIAAARTVKFQQTVSIPSGSPGAPTTSTAPAAAALAPCDEYQRLYDALAACPDFPAALLSTVHVIEIDTPEFAAQRAELCKTSIELIRSNASSMGCALPDTSAPASPPPMPTGAPDPAAAPDPGGHVVFSDSFQLTGQNIEIDMSAPALNNSWAYLVVDLVKEDTGQVATVDGNMESYSGIEDGESWSEGSTTSKDVIAPMGKGSYVLRIEGEHGGGPGTTATAIVTVRQDVFRWRYLGFAMLILGFPLGILGLMSWSHERRRWENSTEGAAPKTPFAILVLVFGSVFTLIGYVIKGVLEASSDD
jgi:hypothetical protein